MEGEAWAAPDFNHSRIDGKGNCQSTCVVFSRCRTPEALVWADRMQGCKRGAIKSSAHVAALNGARTLPGPLPATRLLQRLGARSLSMQEEEREGGLACVPNITRRARRQGLGKFVIGVYIDNSESGAQVCRAAPKSLMHLHINTHPTRLKTTPT